MKINKMVKLEDDRIMELIKLTGVGVVSRMLNYDKALLSKLANDKADCPIGLYLQLCEFFHIKPVRGAK